MKTAFASLFIAFAISASSVSFASTTGKTDDSAPFQSSVVAFPSSMKIDVVVENMENAHVTIRLIDRLGVTQATQWLNKHEKAVRTRFDISGLTDGVYTIVVSDGATTQTKEINISTNVPTPAPYRTVSIG
ncbi:hypothetical protein GCM10028803_03500 [Larkinella knui]|uniref:T9SS C-terminal target domain-containing protein n=1 Tax=Larkinella knui TaxID=2025310 RepID=A0A3P1CLB0_9BACT|nr:hypothetical protein [Larkinella knui]RRB13960.1 hypothetical protein EHT87_17055 [Larkinella knui]